MIFCKDFYQGENLVVVYSLYLNDQLTDSTLKKGTKFWELSLYF